MPVHRPSLIIHRLRIWQPVASDPDTWGHCACIEPDDSPSVATVFAAAPFAIGCELILAGRGAVECAWERPRYRARYIAQDFASGTRRQLGRSSRGRLSVDQKLLLTRLELGRLPRGSYRLFAIATLEGARAEPASFELSLLQVI